jgi:23S rRNA-/tRNA-specific pseudouridylate synthase
MSLWENQDFLIINKPAGIPSHQVDPGKDGILEWWENKRQIKLWPCHRLDKTTSGILVLGKSAEAARRMAQYFESGKVEKRYLMVTDKAFSSQGPTAGMIAASWKTKSEGEGMPIISHSSLIERDPKPYPKRWQSQPTHPSPNSHTEFRLIKRSAYGKSLWEVRPLSGKPHQIRLHARDLGLSILGDETYGGTSYPTLCLHAAGLKCPEFHVECPAPVYFERMGLLEDPVLIHLLAELDARDRLYGPTPSTNQAYRGSVWTSPDRQEHLVLDVLGETLAWTFYSATPIPQNESLESLLSPRWAYRMNLVSQLLKKNTLLFNHFSKQDKPRKHHAPQDKEKASVFFTSRYSFQKTYPHSPDWSLGVTTKSKPNSPAQQIRVTNPAELVYSLSQPQAWLIRELGYSLELRPGGPHYGVFLDQRLNRQRVLNEVKGVSLLNLFCYTGSFSVAAYQGGARWITSVDANRSVLNWAKKNIERNSSGNPSSAGEQASSPPSKLPRLQWIHADVMKWLKKMAARKNVLSEDPPSRYDWIICDPPTFGRGPQGEIFRLEDRLDELLHLCRELLNPGGKILFSCNLARWSDSYVLQRIKNQLGSDFTISTTAPDWDYRLSPPLGQSKMFWIEHCSAAKPVLR